MSTAVTVTQLHDINAIQAVWVLAAGETGDAITWSNFADRTVQFSGTFLSSSLKLEWSNDGVNYVTATDFQGNDIVKTAAGGEAVAELGRYVRPVSTGGTSTAVTVTMFMRRTK